MKNLGNIQNDALILLQERSEAFTIGKATL